jgi:hypothetical protein
MDCPPNFWLNRIVGWIRQEAAYMSEKKTAMVTAKSQSEQYAVIEVRRNEVFPEHFVIAFRGEESLRELIAMPSIIGIGFSSREAAAAVIPNRSSRPADSKNIREKATRKREDDGRGQSRSQRLRHRVALACSTLQNAVAAGVLMFYSKSVRGAVIRAFVGV